MNAILAFSLLLCQGSQENHQKVYDSTVESVVAIRAMAPLGERSGSGVFLSKEGHILCSYAVVPQGSTKIRVWMKGPRQYDAEIVNVSKADEITILKIKPKEGQKLPEFKPMPCVDSSKAQQGDTVYTLGNASNSIINDDSPSLNVGIFSGTYRLSEPRAGASFVGTVIETTAAVNIGIEGGPLLNADGKMIGMITLNYSPNRFLGTAIPWSTLKDPVALLMDPRNAKTTTTEPEAPTGEGSFGATFEDKNGKVVVTAVEKGGAAEMAGITAGTIIIAFGDKPVKDAAELLGRLKGLEAGTKVYFKVNIDGLDDKVTVELAGKKK